jgi:hypothetical protein
MVERKMPSRLVKEEAVRKPRKQKPFVYLDDATVQYERRCKLMRALLSEIIHGGNSITFLYCSLLAKELIEREPSLGKDFKRSLTRHNVYVEA